MADCFAPLPIEALEQSVPSLFFRRCGEQLDRVALRAGSISLSYGELAGRVRGLAAAIGAALPQPGGEPCNVAVLLAHSPDDVVSILAVLAAGHAVVPLDAAQPADRVRSLLQDAEVRLVLSGPLLPDQAHRVAHPIRVLDASHTPLATGGATPDEPVPHLPDSRAYLLYTSGSSGRPKGVEHSHRTLLHQLYRHTSATGLTFRDRHTMIGSCAFAAVLTDLFGTLLNGAELLMYDIRGDGLSGLPGWLARERATVFRSLPSVFRGLLAVWPEGCAAPELRLVRLVGEPLYGRDVRRFRECFGERVTLLNSYGSTELGTVAQFVIGPQTPVGDGIVPAGYPAPGVNVLILGPDRAPLPAGETGEIAVQGRFFARSYWRQPELTAARFLPDPDDPAGVRFLTGDLGRRDPDGRLVHLGRADGQVKIRGFRIEPAEVEAALIATGLVREAAVTVTAASPGSPALCAFVAADAASTDADTIRAALASQLPDFMIPARFVVLDALPKLPHGKIDRAGLLAPPRSGAVSGGHDELEQQLCKLWGRILGQSRISATDIFSELGGDSLNAVRVATAVERTFGVSLPLAELHAAQTVRALAARIRRGGGASRTVVAVKPSGSNPPLFLVPGAGSDVQVLNGIARQLDPAQPLYGLRMRGVAGAEEPDRRVEVIAARLVDKLLAFRRRGPYFLGGISFGGLVAYAMACRLRALGASVGPVFLLDTAAPRQPRRRPGALVLHPVLFGLRWLRPPGAKDDATLFMLRFGVREKYQRLRASLRVPLRQWRGRPLDPLDRILRLQEYCFAATKVFRPQPFDGELVLLRAAVQPHAKLYDVLPSLGWEEHVRGRLRLLETPGLHNDQWNGPAVRCTAAHLSEILAAHAAGSG